ncbi:hypothetical protein [Romboutsia sp.]|uniref:hypothetical protein n=1 Tax=Romboutsia sp. TaxID=1965302 RepID=UPI003F2AC5D8
MKCCSYKTGVIVEIVESSNEKFKYITIAKNPKDIYTFTRLVYSDETLIVDCEYSEISIDDLNVGDIIVAYHSNIMTMSIPPQTSVYIIELK